MFTDLLNKSYDEQLSLYEENRLRALCLFVHRALMRSRHDVDNKTSQNFRLLKIGCASSSNRNYYLSPF